MPTKALPATVQRSPMACLGVIHGRTNAWRPCRGRLTARIVVAMLFTLQIPATLAVLPPSSPDEVRNAAANQRRAVWEAQMDSYRLCSVQDRVAAYYRAHLVGSGRTALPPTPTPACVDPGPFVSQSIGESRPLEASGAHSPTSTAASPPSVRETARELQGGSKQ